MTHVHVQESGTGCHTMLCLLSILAPVVPQRSSYTLDMLCKHLLAS